MILSQRLRRSGSYVREGTNALYPNYATLNTRALALESGGCEGLLSNYHSSLSAQMFPRDPSRADAGLRAAS